MLPFTAEQFFSVFADYNQAVWPMQWFLAAAAVGIVLLSVSRVTWRDRFAVLYLLEAALFAWAIAGRPLDLRIGRDAASALALGMLAYSLVAYPLLGRSLGHAYPASATFGAPCPTAIFTFGILALARATRIGTLTVIPLLWAIVGGSAAFLLGVWQDLGLIVSGIGMAALIVGRRRKARA